jgi:Outer membrane protein beta-barrel domain
VCSPWLSDARGAQWKILTIACWMLVSPALMSAQFNDGDGEVAAFGGGTFGLGGAHPAVGASSGISFSRYGIALIEAAFSPLGDETLRRRTGARVESSRLFDFNFSVHVQVPVRRRWAPYGIVGAALLYDAFRAVPTGAPQDEPGQTPPAAVFAVDEFNFGFQTGGGARYYIGEDWGIRPEFKVIVSNRTYTRFTIGIFYKM